MRENAIILVVMVLASGLNACAIKERRLASQENPAQEFEVPPIYFEYKKTGANEPPPKGLEDVIREITKSKPIQIVLEGHTDNIGSDTYNLRLSQARARQVRQWLINEVYLHQDLIFAVGYGEAEPVASNETDEGRSKNRRVHIRLITAK